MNSSIPRVLIGPMFEDPSESVSSVNRTFAAGLSDRYEFLYSVARVRHGAVRPSLMTLPNLAHAVYQTLQWIKNLLDCWPQVAHYALSSGWAMEKGLLLLMLARLGGCKTVAHLHSGGFPDHWMGLPRWRRTLACRVLHQLDALIVLSPWWRERMRQLTGLPEEKIFIVGNPIDPQFLTAVNPPDTVRNTHLILSLGTLGRDKGIHELIEACSILRGNHIPFHLNIVGPERESGILERVEEQIGELGCQDRVSISPAVHGDKKVKLFRESSIFVLPSYYENYPLVLLEAAAAGLAIISTPVGAVPELFQDEVSALFVSPRSPSELAAAMARLIASESERQRLANVARATILERHQSIHVMRSLDLVYQSLIRGEETHYSSKARPIGDSPDIETTAEHRGPLAHENQ